jgi:hypothetical protein
MVTMALIEVSGNPNVVINYARLAGMFSGMLIGLVVGVIFLVGGIAFLRRTGLGSARTCTVVALIPIINLLCLLYPFGIWSALLVFGDRAKRDFSA